MEGFVNCCIMCTICQVSNLFARLLTVSILTCKGKYHCTADLLLYLLVFSCFGHVELTADLLVWAVGRADLLFDLFRFNQTRKSVVNSTLAKHMNPNK